MPLRYIVGLIVQNQRKHVKEISTGWRYFENAETHTENLRISMKIFCVYDTQIFGVSWWREARPKNRIVNMATFVVPLPCALKNFDVSRNVRGARAKAATVPKLITIASTLQEQQQPNCQSCEEKG